MPTDLADKQNWSPDARLCYVSLDSLIGYSRIHIKESLYSQSFHHRVTDVYQKLQKKTYVFVLKGRKVIPSANMWPQVFEANGREGRGGSKRKESQYCLVMKSSKNMEKAI